MRDPAYVAKLMTKYKYCQKAGIKHHDGGVSQRSNQRMCTKYTAVLDIAANADNTIREAMGQLRFEIAQAGNVCSSGMYLVGFANT